MIITIDCVKIIVSHRPAGVLLILWVTIRCSQRGKEMLMMASMGSIAVQLLLDTVMHIRNFHNTSELGNMSGGLACTIVVFVGSAKSTGVTVPPVIASFN